jgi:hypothetical protein
MELLFTEHDGTVVTVCCSGEYLNLDHGGYGFRTICHNEDIDKLIETLQKAREAIEVLCEFSYNGVYYRVNNKYEVLYLVYLDEYARAWIRVGASNVSQEFLSIMAQALLEKK